MNRSLIKKAKKYCIPLEECISETIGETYGDSSAKKLVELINNFLVKHNIEDAILNYYIKNDYGDYVFDKLEISTYKKKSEERLAEEVKIREEADKLRKEEKYNLFMKLKKEFEG